MSRKLHINNDNSGYFKERKIAAVYMRATGSNVQIYDCNLLPVDPNGDYSIEQSVCRHCTAQCRSCRDKHVNAIRESTYNGNASIYQCDLGLMFWVCPIFRNGKFTGALRGSGYINKGADLSVFSEKIGNGETVAPEKFMRSVQAFPAGDAEKIHSLSEMLLLCAQSLSSGNENYHEMLRSRTKQQDAIANLVDALKVKYPKGLLTSSYPLDKEQQLIASLHRGNKADAENLLNELLAMLIFSNQNNFRYIQLRSLELAVLLVRSGTNFGGSMAAESNTRYIKQIQESKTVEDLTAILHGIVENITGQIVSFQGIPHAQALRKAENYIRENLTRKISLREIAKVAGLSGPYFSTIFKEEMGENLSRYINRLRVEKASKMLLETDFNLSDISVACCFEDQSWFSKIFKSFTGISPGKYRSQGGLMHSSAV